MNTEAPNQLLETISHVASLPKEIINNVLGFALSGKRRRLLRELRSIAISIDELRPAMIKLTDEELKSHTMMFKTQVSKGLSLDSILVEAFAVVREAARRVLSEEPYLVQLMGGIVLHRGMIAEMKTGEGKTLVAILPAYLNALSGKGVHIVTVNDYLAKRDAETMGKVFEFLGMTTGYIISSMQNSAKKTAYDSDVTYCTNNELGFDFLRDNMVTDESQCCQRGLHFCIVDEADSILIDEARTPLIISGPTEDASEGYMLCDAVIKQLKPEHYSINLKEHNAHFTEEGIEEITRILHENNSLAEDEYLYSPKNAVLLHQLSQALYANHLYRLGIDYIVDVDMDGFGGMPRPAVKIIDEHTGRTLQGRRYSEGLHQALEAKEHVPIRPESETLASVTFQRLFRLYHKLSGMTGTAMTEAEEFEKTYNLRCIDIPTNMPKQRIDHDDLIYITKREKIRAIVDLVSECHDRGQPVIIGTTNVESSEELGEILARSGFSVNVLNAKHHEKEADIIANAGRYGAVTVVTNMAGRGTDIKLGGDFKVLFKKRTIGMTDEAQIEAEAGKTRNEIQENKAKVIAAGGLYVIGVEHNNNRRIDNQLRGRSGRQGDPGASKFFMSTEDELIRKFNPNMGAMLRQLGAKDEEVMEHPWLTGAVSNAQQRMEAYNFEVRQSLQKYADIRESYVMEFYARRREWLKCNPVEELTKIFESVVSDKDGLQKMLDLNEGCKDVNELRSKFYDQIKLYKEQYSDDSALRKILLHAIDVNCRRYMTLMANAKDVVAFQSYSQKDPIMAYYSIAKDKFKEMMANVNYELLTDLFQDQVEDDVDYEDLIQKMMASINLEVERLKTILPEESKLADAEPDEEKLGTREEASPAEPSVNPTPEPATIALDDVK